MAKWRGQDADLTMKESTGGTTVTVGILQEVEVTVNREISELYGMGSRTRQDQQQSEFSVAVSATIASWNKTGYEDIVGISGSTLNDSSDVPLFQITGQFEDTDGNTMDLEVCGIYFEDVPLSASTDEWVTITLDGKGKDVSVS